MSKWSKNNCIVTDIGNQALSQISATGGTMTFQKVYVGDTRVDTNTTSLASLTTLPGNTQVGTLVRAVPQEGGYRISTQFSNEFDLTASDFTIETIGIYMKLDGFNSNQQFLYMVMQCDDDVSKETLVEGVKTLYSYDIYLYHTSQANLTINISSQDYVSGETFAEEAIRVNTKIQQIVYHTDFTNAEVITTEANINYLKFTTEGNIPFQLPEVGDNSTPLLIIKRYSGDLAFLSVNGIYFSTAAGFYLDDVGPFEMLPYRDDLLDTYSGYTFDNEDLICVLQPSRTAFKVLNYFDENNYLEITDGVYSNFNAIPLKNGIYSVDEFGGDVLNSPEEGVNEYKVVVLSSTNSWIMLAITPETSKIYRRVAFTEEWGTAEWEVVGGGKGVKTASVDFVTATSNELNSDGTYLNIKIDDVDDLVDKDLFSCVLSTPSTKTNSVNVGRIKLNGSLTSIYLYDTTGYAVPCCQLPVNFILQYDSNPTERFILLTPPNKKVTVSSTEPTGGKHGDIWYEVY